MIDDDQVVEKRPLAESDPRHAEADTPHRENP
jgi:hypothetical protein